MTENNKHMNLTTLSKYISYLLIPPVMNLYIFILFSFTYEVSPNNYYGLAFSLIFGLLLPLISILEFRRRGILSNNDATIKEERTIPYLFAIGFSLLGVTISSIIGLNEKLIMLWLIYLINSIFIMNINRFWKISAHAIGVAMPLGALIMTEEITWMVVTIFILLIVSISRLILKVHTFLQVVAGSLLGFMVSFVLLNYCL